MFGFRLQRTLLCQETFWFENKYTADDLIIMLEFLVSVCGEKVFQHIVGIPMGINCAPLLADIFLYPCDAEYIQALLSAGKKHTRLKRCTAQI